MAHDEEIEDAAALLAANVIGELAKKKEPPLLPHQQRMIDAGISEELARDRVIDFPAALVDIAENPEKYAHKPPATFEEAIEALADAARILGAQPDDIDFYIRRTADADGKVGFTLRVPRLQDHYMAWRVPNPAPVPTLLEAAIALGRALRQGIEEAAANARSEASSLEDLACRMR